MRNKNKGIDMKALKVEKNITFNFLRNQGFLHVMGKDVEQRPYSLETETDFENM